jgi:hypothetical protein
MKTIFKVGDKVFDYQFGWGEVSRIKDDGSVYVEFSNKYYCVYGSSGKFTPSHINPTLSFTEYTLKGFSQERPELLPEKGDVVWGRDRKDETWEVCHFVEKQDNCFLVSFDDPFDDEGHTICYKFLTSVNPYKK